MIFYFTGTGNSWYAASKVLHEEEKLISIKTCMQKHQYAFEVAEGESVGFVFPVYFWGIPSIVQVFLNHLRIKGSPDYVYGLLTCGAQTGNASGLLAQALKKKDLEMNAVYRVIMPDSYCILYDTPADEEIQRVLEKADIALGEIREKIENRENGRTDGTIGEKTATLAMYPLYVHGRKTKNFYADDRCIGCGVCASRCPVRAIEMQDGKPTWIKDRCVLCMACFRCNAIQAGKWAMKHRRYVNPEYKTFKEDNSQG